MRSEAFETLFGGAAGGGKTYAQAVDAFLFALKYAGSRQLLLRRTLPEIDRSLVPLTLSLYPTALARYLTADHRWQFANGSVLEFGYCDAENDVTRYQSAEYDVLRFDELTHFTEGQFTYLLSRVRGVNGYPKRVKSTANPGGVGHTWVKSRYIDPLVAGEISTFPHGTRLFLPASVRDNPFLQRADPQYEERLKMLSERDRRALLDGDWNLTDGQFFTEFRPEIHVVRPHDLPSDWKRFLSIDYGLDMLAALWIASDGYRAVVYREVYQSGLILPEAARVIREAESEKIYCRYAPPDLWGRRQETGRSAIDRFAEDGLYFEKSDNRRESGWLAVKELLRPDGNGEVRLTIFDSCRNLIRTLPALRPDPRNPNDVASTPHELTHAPDALRGFACEIREENAAPIRMENEIGSFLGYR